MKLPQRKHLVIFILLLGFACQQTAPEYTTVHSSLDSTQVQALSKPKPIEELWQQLVFEEGGCLTGGQFVVNGTFGDRLCVMTQNKDWQAFFQKDTQELSAFLLGQLSDTTTTQIHTCPFLDASVGEVAVYSLQNIYKQNWYDLPGFVAFQNREASSAEENHQAWLQHILEDDEQRIRMKDEWQSLVRK